MTPPLSLWDTKWWWEIKMMYFGSRQWKMKGKCDTIRTINNLLSDQISPFHTGASRKFNTNQILTVGQLLKYFRKHSDFIQNLSEKWFTETLKYVGVFWWKPSQSFIRHNLHSSYDRKMSTEWFLLEGNLAICNHL